MDILHVLRIAKLYLLLHYQLKFIQGCVFVDGPQWNFGLFNKDSYGDEMRIKWEVIAGGPAYYTCTTISTHSIYTQ